MGSVFVNGNVDDGFVIKASGNIEVKGSVGRAELDTEGDIVVSQGIMGKEGGVIRAGKSIWSKFIQNTDVVEAGDMVIVSDGIIKSNVMAKRKEGRYNKRQSKRLRIYLGKESGKCFRRKRSYVKCRI